MRKADRLTIRFLALFLLPMLSAWSEDTHRAERSVASAVQLSLSGDALTVDSKGASLAQVLKQLSRQSAVSIVVDNSVANQPVWATFHDVPIQEGLRRLLRDHSYIVVGAGVTSASRAHPLAKRAKISVLGSQPSPDSRQETIATGREDRQPASAPPVSLADMGEVADSETQIATLEALANQDASEPLMASLAVNIHDGNPEVREAAVDLLKSMNLDNNQHEPIKLITALALTDPSPELRMAALEILAETGSETALDPLGQALQDPVSQVSELAQALFDELAASQGAITQ